MSSASLFAQAIPADSSASFEARASDSSSADAPDSLLQKVSLSASSECPADTALVSERNAYKAEYAKCAQALGIAINSQVDKKQLVGGDRSNYMAATSGSFVGGILIGLLLGWWLL